MTEDGPSYHNRGMGTGAGCKHFALAGAEFKPSLGSVAIVAVCFAFLSSPDGSYTEDQSQESEVKVLATDFDDEFDDEESLPAIGTCKALYTFEGNTASHLIPPTSRELSESLFSFCDQAFF